MLAPNNFEFSDAEQQSNRVDGYRGPNKVGEAGWKTEGRRKRAVGESIV